MASESVRLNIGHRMALECAHRDCNTTLGPQWACISPCHQLNNIYRALGAFWLCLITFWPHFKAVLPLAASLSAVHCGWEVPAERAGPSSPAHRLPSRPLFLIYPGVLMETTGPGKNAASPENHCCHGSKTERARHFNRDLI